MSTKKFHRVTKDVTRFVGKVKFKLEFELIKFSNLYIYHLVFFVKMWYNFEFICYI
jgi:hypothetical protein